MMPVELGIMIPKEHELISNNITSSDEIIMYSKSLVLAHFGG